MSDFVRLVAGVVASYFGQYWVVIALAAYNYMNRPDGRRPGLNEPSPFFNQTSSDAPIPVYYGFARVDPIIVFRDVAEFNPVFEAPGSNLLLGKFLWLVCIIGEGEIGGVDALYLDGTISTDKKYAASVVYEYFLGTDAQAASVFLTTLFPTKFSATDIGAGIAYAVVGVRINMIAFPRGEPKIAFDIRGKKVKDTRDGVTRFSPNPALCTRDYWTNVRYGRKVAEAKINDPNVTAEANYFEERLAIPVIATTFTADPATDTLTLGAAQPLQTGNQVLLTTTGVLPAGLALATVYVVIYLSPTTIKLASSAANAQAGTAVDITGAGTGVHTATTTTALDFSADPSVDTLVFAVDVPFDNGDGVRLSSTGALPGGTAPATTYYWIRGADKDALVSQLTFYFPGTPARTGRIATTYANALARIPIDLTTAGTGVLTCTHFDQPRYTCAGRIDPTANPFDSLAALRSSCRSWFFESGGFYHLIADRISAPGAFELTVDNIVGSWSIDMGDPQVHYNRVESYFRNALKEFGNDMEPSDNVAERTTDGGRVATGSLKLEMTSNPYMARRLAQLERRASRLGIRVSCNVHVQGFRAFPGDVIKLTHPTPGFVNKLFRLARFEHATDDEYKIELFEYSDTQYDPDPLSPTVLPIRSNLPALLTQAVSVPPTVSGLEVFNQGKKA